MLAGRAARTAARSRGLAAGSGRPVRAAVVSSRMILVKTLARFLSCAPFRYMMFLNCEWPAIGLRAAPPPTSWPASSRGAERRANNPIWQDWGASGGGDGDALRQLCEAEKHSAVGRCGRLADQRS